MPGGRSGRVVASIGALVVLWWCLGTAPGAVAAPAAHRSEAGVASILVVSVPGLTWRSVDPVAMPLLAAWLDHAAVASMNTATAPDRSFPDAYLSMGAGQRAEVGDAVVRRDEGGARIEPMGPLRDRNERSRFGADVGAWGAAARIGLVSLGGTADDAVAFAAMDADGRVDGTFLAHQSNGRRPAAAIAREAVGRDVVLVELPAVGDVSSGDVSTGDMDDLLGEVIGAAPEGALVMVVNPVSTGGSPFGVFALRGPGITPGLAVSSTTRRDGVVSLVDVAPMTLRRLGIERPASMIDAEVTSVADARPGWERADHLESLEARALDRERTWIAHTIAYVVLVVVAGFAGLVPASGRRRGAAPAAVLGLAVLVLPTVDLVVRGVGGWRLADGLQVAAVPALAVAIAAAARPRLHRCAGDALALAAGAYLVVVSADLVLGWGWQDDGTWGNSSVLGATSRFVGLGNLAFALLSAMTVVVLARLAERPAGGGHSRPDGPRLTAAVVLVVLWMVVLDGAPGWGADVGGVLAGIPAFALMLWVLAGRRLSVRAVIGAGAIGVASLGLFSVVDARRPVEDRTHLTRFVSGLVGGEGGRTFRRKFLSNLDIMLASWWWVAIIVVALAVAYRRGPGVRRALGELAVRHPVLVRLRGPAALLVALTLLVNDSGFAPPALQVVVLVGVLVTLVAVEDRPGPMESPDGVRSAATPRTPQP